MDVGGTPALRRKEGAMETEFDGDPWSKMNSLRTVAVGFDGTADSKVALLWAVALCELTGAMLRVIHVVGLLEERNLTHFAPVAADAAVQIATEGGLPAHRFEWEQLSGSPSEALLRATNPPNPVDLLVLGTGGSARFPGTLLGSTSLEVAQLSSVPVTIVPNLDRSQNAFPRAGFPSSQWTIITEQDA
jgi:nucleotide-binding universal stress UspA family protein